MSLFSKRSNDIVAVKFLAFIGISDASIKLDYKKYGEVQVYKLSQGRRNNGLCQNCWKRIVKRWQARWMVIHHNSICYYKSPTSEPFDFRDSICLDSSSRIEINSLSNSKIEMVIFHSRRRLQLKIYNLFTGLTAIRGLCELFLKSEYTKIQPYGSFAPKRLRNAFEYFSDGEGYFKKVFETMQSAKKEILICGWMISPEMPLVRPHHPDAPKETSSRLDHTLWRAAQRGVSVYVLVYKEFSKMYNDSEHVKSSFEKLHKRIKVIRHPNVVISMWSHHEKLVVVDRNVVFVGGLDLTWGRYDSCEHTLLSEPEGSLETMFPGVDYYNPLVKDINKGRVWQQALIPKSTPRMPWHDVAVVLFGPIVKDYVTHFINYWNHARETSEARQEGMFQYIIQKDDEGKPTYSSSHMENVPKEVRDIFAGLDFKSMLESAANKQAEQDFEEQTGLGGSGVLDGLLNMMNVKSASPMNRGATTMIPDPSTSNSAFQDGLDDLSDEELLDGDDEGVDFSDFDDLYTTGQISPDQDKEQIMNFMLNEQDEKDYQKPAASKNSSEFKVVQQIKKFFSKLDKSYWFRNISVPSSLETKLKRPTLPKSPDFKELESLYKMVTPQKIVSRKSIGFSSMMNPAAVSSPFESQEQVEGWANIQFNPFELTMRDSSSDLTSGLSVGMIPNMQNTQYISEGFLTSNKIEYTQGRDHPDFSTPGMGSKAELIKSARSSPRVVYEDLILKKMYNTEGVSNLPKPILTPMNDDQSGDKPPELDFTALLKNLPSVSPPEPAQTALQTMDNYPEHASPMRGHLQPQKSKDYPLFNQTSEREDLDRLRTRQGSHQPHSTIFASK